MCGTSNESTQGIVPSFLTTTPVHRYHSVREVPAGKKQQRSGGGDVIRVQRCAGIEGRAGLREKRKDEGSGGGYLW